MTEDLDIYVNIPIPNHVMGTFGNLTYNFTSRLGAPPGASDQYIDHQHVINMKFTIGIILIPVFATFGCVGNIMSLVVLWQVRMRNPTNYILGSLSVSDFLFLIHCLLFAGINIKIQSDPIQGENIRNSLYPFLGAYSSLVFARITSWLTTLLSIERFIAVYFPIKAKTICNKRNTIGAIIGIYVLTILLFLPYLFKYKTRTVPNSGKVLLLLSDFCKTTKFFDVYGFIMNVLFRFIPICLVVILNAFIIIVIRKAWNNRQTISNIVNTQRSLGEQNRINIMLVIVTSMFVICIIPGAGSSIATHVWPQYSRIGKARNLYEGLSYVTYFLETLNSSINFLIYMALSKRFFITFKGVFLCQRFPIHWSLASYTSVNRDKFLGSKRRATSKTSTGSCDSRYSMAHHTDPRSTSLKVSQRYNAMAPNGCHRENSHKTTCL